jgi:hypothetical protein
MEGPLPLFPPILAVYEAKASHPGDAEAHLLGFESGDKIIVIEKHDQQWMTGWTEARGFGYVASSFVTLLRGYPIHVYDSRAIAVAPSKSVRVQIRTAPSSSNATPAPSISPSSVGLISPRQQQQQETVGGDDNVANAPRATNQPPPRPMRYDIATPIAVVGESHSQPTSPSYSSSPSSVSLHVRPSTRGRIPSGIALPSQSGHKFDGLLKVSTTTINYQQLSTTTNTVIMYWLIDIDWLVALDQM